METKNIVMVSTRKENSGETFILATDADENLKVFVNASVEDVISKGYKVYRICVSRESAENAKQAYFKEKIQYIAVQLPNGQIKTRSWMKCKYYPINTTGVFKTSVDARSFASSKNASSKNSHIAQKRA